MQLFGKFPLVRLKQFRDNPRFIWYYLKRLVWYKYTSHRHIPRYRNMTFLTPAETLEHLLSKRMSIARFGDGDIEQLTGAGEYPPDSDWSQRASPALQAALDRVLRADEPQLLIAPVAPSVFLASKAEATARGELYTMWTDMRIMLHRYLKVGRPYGDANVFIPKHHPDFDWSALSVYLRDKDVVIVTGGTDALRSTVSFGRSTHFVECGKHDAFERYEEIVAALQQVIAENNVQPESALIMASLGPTADILALDFTKRGFQVWDTGHFFRYAHEQISQYTQV